MGANETVTLQLEPTGSELLHVVDTKAKFVPATEAAVGAVMASGPGPLLLMVAESERDSPEATPPNAMSEMVPDWIGPLPAVAVAFAAVPGLVFRPARLFGTML